MSKQVKSTEMHVPQHAVVHDVCKQFSTLQHPFVAGDTAEDIVNLLHTVGSDEVMKTVAVLRSSQQNGQLDQERIKKVFGASASSLYEAASHLDRIQAVASDHGSSKTSDQRDRQLGRMIVSIVNDARVVVIHLSEQLQRLKNSRGAAPSIQQELAKRTFSIYAPLANRLGIWRLKWQLEDLAFKYLDRPAFDNLALAIDERRVERERYIDHLIEQLRQIMNASGVTATIQGRAKHIYGIWRKSKEKQLDFDSIYDLRAVRILVDDISSCYVALGAVHASWSHIAEEFDDYITVPKANGYQSIHTAVVGPEEKVIEVQIRTNEMHEHCELGSQAHWKYKEGNQVDSNYQENKIRWLRHILEWRDEIVGQFDGELTDDSKDEQIYVFTPAGNVVELPVGATPIDFSYAIHTEVGHRCRGATVNGRIVPLNRPLDTGDWVEIKTVKRGGPSRDWLSSNNSFVITHRARHAIGRWFRLEEYGRYLTQGRVMLEKELSRRGLLNVNFEKLAVQNSFRRTQDLFTAIGMKELKVAHALACLVEDPTEEIKTVDPSTLFESLPSTTSSLSVYGVDNLLSSPASCCEPLPGDDVLGYVTVNRGITLHKRECRNIGRLAGMNPERVVEVGWQVNDSTLYAVTIEVTAEGDSTLLPDITSIATDLKVELSAINTASLKAHQIGRVLLTAEFKNANQVSRMLHRLAILPTVIEAKRLVRH